MSTFKETLGKEEESFVGGDTQEIYQQISAVMREKKTYTIRIQYEVLDREGKYACKKETQNYKVLAESDEKAGIIRAHMYNDCGLAAYYIAKNEGRQNND